MVAPKDILTPEDARRALYIDFEGRKDEPPVLLGMLYATGRSFDKIVLRHVVLNPALEPLVGAVRIEGLDRYECERQTMKQVVADLLKRARSKSRPIVSWSQHEQSKISEDGMTGNARRWLPEWYRDAKATAKRWVYEAHPQEVQRWRDAGEKHRLVNYMALVGMEYPAGTEGGAIGDRINRVRHGLATRGSWESLVETQRQAWTEVVIHNAVDCLATRRVAMEAAAFLADR